MAFLAQSPDDQGQNQNNLTPQNNQGGQPMAPPVSPVQPIQGGINTGSEASAPMGAPAPTPKGSGRFTNLQKYVQANQGAGERTAAAVQKGIQKSLDPFQKQAGQVEQAGQQGIQSGQQTIQSGQAVNTQMSAPEFNAQRAVEFANQASNVERVGQFRTGQAVDEAALQKQNEAFQQANINLGGQVNTQGEAVGSEIGRIGLLKQAFGGQNKPGYSQGQSRLDNLLLQSNGQNIQSLQNQIQNEQSNVRNLQARAAAQGKSIEQVIADESKLAKDITGTTEANIGRFKTDLGGQVAGFNKDLEAGIKSGNTFIDFYNKAVTDDQFKSKYGISKKEYQFNKPLFEQFGLQSGQQTFNVFNNQDLNLGQVADIEARRAQDFRDVATQQNVAEYDALARLRGLEKAQYELDKASDINKAGFKQKEGAASLQGRIDKARTEFLDQAKNRLIEGGTGYVEGVKGAGYVSLADYLKNPDYYKRAQVQFNDGSGGNLNALQQYGSGLMGLGAPGLSLSTGIGDTRDVTNTINNVNSGIKQIDGGGALGNFLSIQGNVLGEISRGLFGAGGGNDTGKGQQYVIGRTIGGGIYGDQTREGFEGAATGQALQNYLNSQGFGNYLTEGGVQQGSSQLEDMAREFGYRTNVQGEGVKQGFYNPMFERQAIEQAATQSGPLTREQIAEMSRTGGTASQQAARQGLIDQGRYLTSDKEFGEIQAREQATSDQALQAQINQDLKNRFQQSDAYKNRIAAADSRAVWGGRSRFDMGIADQLAAQQARQVTDADAMAFGQGLTGDQSYMDFLNNLQTQQQADTQKRISGQVYGRNPGQGELNTTQVGKSGPLTAQEILSRMGRG
jgi:hypothetical protein